MQGHKVRLSRAWASHAVRQIVARLGPLMGLEPLDRPQTRPGVQNAHVPGTTVAAN